ncbi:MAG: DNA polymerase [Akkermansiaceae bacterium]|nr:DNA polymerase [Akkermansiaceae bacterium]
MFHYTPPIDFGVEPTLLVSDANGKVERWSLDKLAACRNQIVTHSFSLLVDWFRQRDLPLPKIVIDLEVASKLITGRPKSDFDNERPWDMASVLRPLIPRNREERLLRATMATHLAKPDLSDFGNLRWMTAIAKGLPSLWETTIGRLKEEGEYERFLKVEVPAYGAMLATQYKGIQLDETIRDRFLGEIEKEYRQAHYTLAILKKIDVERALGDAEYLLFVLGLPSRKGGDLPEIQDLIAAREDFDETCRLLGDVLSARRNKGILLRSFGAENGICYPYFDSMGTVTGRILTIDPQLQHLAKKYRAIIRPRPNHRLRYVDYSQFEPNIMACICNDPQLLELCREGDLYEKLSTELFGSNEHRKVCKLMFLAYSYGKQVSTLSNFVHGLFPSKKAADYAINAKFAPLFVGVEKWKATVHVTLKNDGKIGTLLGNCRYRTKDGDLDNKEKRWAISQVIQGTGSLILKLLINRVTSELPHVAVLLPMHDALLVEVPEEGSEDSLHALTELCRTVFLELCVALEPAISQKPFFEK